MSGRRRSAHCRVRPLITHKYKKFRFLKNIIFDFGNVLVRWEPQRVFLPHFDNDEAKYWHFWRHVCDDGWRNRIDAGEPMDACIRERQQHYPDYAEAVELYRSRWEETLPGEVPGMYDLVKTLVDAGAPAVYGLTNWSMETFPQARRRFPVLQLIENYVVSGDVRLVKPDPRIFRLLLDRYGLKAEESLFVDDNPDNVAAAQALGLHGIVFAGADELRQRLAAPELL